MLPTVWLSALTPLTFGTTRNKVEAVPPGVVSLKLPLRAVAGTTTSTSRAVLETIVAGALPANTAWLVSPRPLPKIFTVAPASPLLGAEDVIVGLTVNSPALVAAPPLVLTVMGPLLASVGTVTLIAVCELSVTCASIFWWAKRTRALGANPVPLILIVVPVVALPGEKPLIVGWTRKFP